MVKSIKKAIEPNGVKGLRYIASGQKGSLSLFVEFFKGFGNQIKRVRGGLMSPEAKLMFGKEIVVFQIEKKAMSNDFLQ